MKKTENGRKRFTATKVLCTLGAVAILVGGAYVIGKNSANNGQSYIIPTPTPTNGQYQQVYYVDGQILVDNNNNPVNGYTNYVVATSKVNIRSEAKTGNNIVLTLDVGKALPLEAIADGTYYKVRCNGRMCYVNRQFVNIMSGADYAAYVQSQVQPIITQAPYNTPVPTAQPTATVVPNIYYVVANQDVYIKQAPGYDAANLSVLYQGQGLIYMGNEGNEWIKVSVNGVPGYIHRNYVTIMTADQYYQSQLVPTTNTPAPVGEGYYVVSTKNVNIRPEPNKRCNVYEVLKTGKGLKYIRTYDNDWYVVEYNGGEAYISTEFSKLVPALEYNNNQGEVVDTPSYSGDANTNADDFGRRI